MPMKAYAISRNVHIAGVFLSVGMCSVVHAEESQTDTYDAVKSIGAIEYRFRENQSQLEAVYRKNLADVIAKATSGEILLVEFDLAEATRDGERVRIRRNVGYDGSSSGYGTSGVLGDPNESSTEYFWIAPYGVESLIISKRTLEAGSEELTALRQRVAEAVRNIDGGRTGGLGHMPTHVIRLYGEDGTRTLFETSVSPLFNNAWVRYPGHAVYWKWHALPSQDLRKFLEGALPTPREYGIRYQETVKRLTGRESASVHGK